MSDTVTSIARTAWDLVYRISPILLTGGIASSLSSSFSTSGLFGPILSSLSAVGIPVATFLDPVGLLTSGDPTNINLDSLFAHFTPLAGGTLLDHTAATYPYANQTTAGNAVIQNQLEISMLMECAYRGQGGMLTRIAALAAFQATIAEHIAQGGTFTVITPGMIYTNALSSKLTDISSDPTMPQTAFQWDFVRPLISEQEAAAASSTFVSKITGGQVSDGSWVQASYGNPAASLLGGLF